MFIQLLPMDYRLIHTCILFFHIFWCSTFHHTCPLLTIRSEQERKWQEKFNTMEYILTMDAQQAEKERDELDVALQDRILRLSQAEMSKQQAERKLIDLVQRSELLEKVNRDLEEKCVWGSELEQAYEVLHSKIEVLIAERDAAVKRALRLEKEQNRIHSFALSEGLQLPSFATNEGDD